MSGFPIRPIEEREFDAFAETVSFAFSEHADPAEVEADRRVFENDRSLAAFDGEDLVAGAGAFSLRMTVPGAVLPVAGVTAVGVAPTHRRRGLLTALMRRQLDDVRERGEPLAALYTSESSIYGRFGYGLASFTTRIEIEREATAYLPHLGQAGGRLRRVGREELPKLAGPAYERIRGSRPGMLERSSSWREHRLSDPESHRVGFGPLFAVVHEDDRGVVDGHVLYRFKHDWDSGITRSVLEVEELLGERPEVEAALWRFCFEVDLATTIRAWNRPVDDPLHHLLLDPRRLRASLRDGLWVRVLDVASALAGRRYGCEGRLVMDFHDAWEPAWGGTFALEGGPHDAVCEPTDADPDLRMSVADLGAAYLGAAYLGGVRPGWLARAGRVEEVSPGAIRRADAMFGWDPAPWCPETF